MSAERSHELAMEHIPVAELHTYYRNPRQGDTTAIARSLRVNGQYKPVVGNRGTHTGRRNEVLAGNHTLMAARDEGWAELAVCWVDVDEDAAARIVAADNRTGDLGSYDDRLLAELLGDLPDLDGTGYEPSDLDKLTAALGGDPLDSGEEEDYRLRHEIVVECTDEAQQARLYERFSGEGLNCRVLTL